MKIGIEAQRIFRANKHGMDYVVLQEILQLQRHDHENEYFVFVKPGPDRCVEDSDNVHVIELNMPTYPLWEQIALPRAARRYHVDLLHCTSNTAPVWGNTPPCPVRTGMGMLRERNFPSSGRYTRQTGAPTDSRKHRKRPFRLG